MTDKQSTSELPFGTEPAADPKPNSPEDLGHQHTEAAGELYRAKDLKPGNVASNTLTEDDMVQLFAWAREQGLDFLGQEPDARRWLYFMSAFTRNDLRELCKWLKERRALLPLEHCCAYIKNRGAA